MQCKGRHAARRSRRVQLQTRPLLRHAAECFGSAGVAGRSCHPSLSLVAARGKATCSTRASPLVSRQSTGCATHLAHVHVCGISLSPSLPSLLLPSAALPSLASAPSLPTYMHMSFRLGLMFHVASGRCRGRPPRCKSPKRRPMQRRVQRRARTCALRPARTCAVSPAARFGIDALWPLWHMDALYPFHGHQCILSRFSAFIGALNVCSAAPRNNAAASLSTHCVPRVQCSSIVACAESHQPTL